MVNSKWNIKTTFFIISCGLFLKTTTLFGQRDSLSGLKTKNQLYVEVLGNNFFDANSNMSFVSVNYARKIYGLNSNFIISLGISEFQSKWVDYNTMPITYPTTTVIAIPTGFLWQMNYKRNGLWVGLYFTPTFGKQWYQVEVPNNVINNINNFSFQLTPNLCYQFQNKSENFLLKFSFTPKIYASVFSDKNKYKYGKYYFMPIWGGVSIGGGW